MTDNAIDAARDEGMPRLNGHQPAEPTTKNEHWPEPQRAAGTEEENAKPPNAITVQNPELVPICIASNRTRTPARARPRMRAGGLRCWILVVDRQAPIS